MLSWKGPSHSTGIFGSSSHPHTSIYLRRSAWSYRYLWNICWKGLPYKTISIELSLSYTPGLQEEGAPSSNGSIGFPLLVSQLLIHNLHFLSRCANQCATELGYPHILFLSHLILDFTRTVLRRGMKCVLSSCLRLAWCVGSNPNKKRDERIKAGETESELWCFGWMYNVLDECTMFWMNVQTSKVSSWEKSRTLS